MRSRLLIFIFIVILAPVPGVTHADSAIVTADVFVVAMSETFRVGNSQGDEARNRAARPVSGTVRNLYLQANQQPARSSRPACASMVSTPGCARPK